MRGMLAIGSGGKGVETKSDGNGGNAFEASRKKNETSNTLTIGKMFENVGHGEETPEGDETQYKRRRETVLKKNDKILAINDEPITSAQDFISRVNQDFELGDTIEVTRRSVERQLVTHIVVRQNII